MVVLYDDPDFKPKAFEMLLTDGSVDGYFTKVLTMVWGAVLAMAWGVVLTMVWEGSEMDDMLTWTQIK